jgi:hypothetical protein
MARQWHDVNIQQVRMCEFANGNEPLYCANFLAYLMYAHTARYAPGCPHCTLCIVAGVTHQLAMHAAQGLPLARDVQQSPSKRRAYVQGDTRRPTAAGAGELPLKLSN